MNTQVMTRWPVDVTLSNPSRDERIRERVRTYQRSLSESVIPAVPGEFYAYPVEFTKERPLYAFMKCKANKSRPIEDAGDLGREVNLLFLFGGSVQAQVCSVRTAQIAGILDGSVNRELFGKTWIAPAGITAEDFYKLRLQKDVLALIAISQAACSEYETSSVLQLGSVMAMMTDGNKYGLFCVTDLTPTSIQIDACHVLL